MQSAIKMVLGAALLSWSLPLCAETIPVGGPAIAAGNARFAGPATWTIERKPKLVRIVAPEGDVTLTMVDVGDAKDSAAAVTAAWALAEPTFTRKLRLATPQPAKDGWAEAVDYDYETSPNERLAVFASAYRDGTRWTVMLGTGAYATFNKRSGAITTFFTSIRPAAYRPESFAGRTPKKLDAARIAQLKAFLKDSMTQLGIPGVSYAFIQDGRIVDEGGLGYRTLGKPEPVDAHTRFMIASNTKGMTTLLLAQLVDAGKLRWDEPVVEAYPAFRLGDPAVTKSVQVRHLVCACTGMPRQDMEWIMTGDSKTPPARVFEMLATMKPTSGFGEMYQYSNLLAATAGYVAAHVAYPDMEVGAGYDRAMHDMIFAPLGMTETTFDNDVAIAGNRASPHGDDVDGHPAVGAFDMNDSIAFARPAGGAWSTAHDVALYALDELNEGRLANGKQLVSRANLLKRRERGVQTGEGMTYGMGLENKERYGVRLITHGGSMAGYKSNWMVLPEAGAGVVILTNADNGRILVDSLLTRRLLEVLYDGKPEAQGDLTGYVQSMRADQAVERKRLTVPADPGAVARLASRYTNPEIGHIDVSSGPKGLVFDFGSFSSTMITRKNDDGTTSFVMADPGLVGWPIVARPGTPHDALVLRDAQHEYVYAAVP